ncbi:MAG: DNA repair protein RecN [Bacteroidales bacterium]|nr:DNA repair protein RecN [Bacteroidales bacterium]
MLKRLLIENYALIDHLDIAFPGELVIITGETGAGKSILLGALSLALGGRSDISVVKDPGRNCVVETTFEEAGREVPVRRVITPQGRSRCFVDDEPVPMDRLRETASRWVDIHAQHQQLLLAERDFPLNVLDQYAGLAQAVADHGRTWQDLLAAEKELAALDARIAASLRERDYLEFQYRQLDEAALRDGELEELEAEQSLLAHAEAVKEQVEQVEQGFSGGEFPLEATLKEMVASLDKIARYYPAFGELGERIESARIELKDIREEVAALGERVVFSPERLEAVDARLSLLYGLQRKFGVATVAELVSLRDDLSARLAAAVDDELGRETLAKRVETLREACLRSATALHEARLKAAPGLAAQLQDDVRQLELPRARFVVEVEAGDRVGADGLDTVRFLFDANDRGLQPLAKCASGGELSRVMLCIKALLARYQGMPTLIFDEIDAGVSGSVAEKMGRMLARMGGNMQVIAITHLPQVASKGSAHFLVYKEAGAAGIQTRIRPLEGADRVREIARMLSGENITPEALANAGVLLQEDKS